MYRDLNDTQPITVEKRVIRMERPLGGIAEVPAIPGLIRKLEHNGWRVAEDTEEETQPIEPVQVEVEYPASGLRFTTTLELARRIVRECGFIIRRFGRKGN
jgi:hypothetical protein